MKSSTRRQAFQPWLEARAFDIVQPDVTKCGGLSEQRRIAWTAREHGVRLSHMDGIPPWGLLLTFRLPPHSLIRTW